MQRCVWQVERNAVNDGRGSQRYRGRAAMRAWLLASLRELRHPLVLAYIAAAAVVGVARVHTVWPDVDVPMHYFGALTLSYLLHRTLEHAMQRAVLPALGWSARALAIFALACAAAVFWELGEFLSDRYFGTATQPGLADTMWDFLVNMLGSVTFIAAHTLLRARRSARSAPAAGPQRPRGASERQARRALNRP